MRKVIVNEFLSLDGVMQGLPALTALGLLTAVMVAMIAAEAVRYTELRERVRHEDGFGSDPADVVHGTLDGGGHH